MRLPEICYASPLYRFLLRGPTPRHLARVPPPALPGNAARGAAIADGTLTLAGKSISLSRLDSQTDLPPALYSELHGFAWLDDLAAVGGPAAQEAARRLIGAWLESNDRWSAAAWAPAVLGERIASWLRHARLIARGDNDPLDANVLASLARQMRHLARVYDTGDAGVGRFVALRGLVYGLACGLGSIRRIPWAVRQLSSELHVQVLSDGGHVTRSPADHLRVLAALVDMRDMLKLAELPVPAGVEEAVDLMAEMMALYRHGDGRLALFNGTTEGDEAAIGAVVGRAAAVSTPMATAAYTGFERLHAGATSVILDCGSPPPKGFDRHGHAGTLSFEMSCSQERLIVNCGAQPAAEPAWQAAQRATAAHSTITIDDTNSSEIVPGNGFRRRAVVAERARETADGNIWVTANHDGYRSTFGLVHRRRLYLAGDGRDLRGEDVLNGAHNGYATARFHLHPDVRVSMLQNDAAVLLRLPSGSAWRFQATGGRLDLAESVYFGNGERRRSEQITIQATLEGQGAQLKWAFKRLTT